jgi:hypothetical protein
MYIYKKSPQPSFVDHPQTTAMIAPPVPCPLPPKMYFLLPLGLLVCKFLRETNSKALFVVVQINRHGHGANGFEAEHDDDVARASLAHNAGHEHISSDVYEILDDLSLESQSVHARRPGVAVQVGI